MDIIDVIHSADMRLHPTKYIERMRKTGQDKIQYKTEVPSDNTSNIKPYYSNIPIENKLEKFEQRQIKINKEPAKPKTYTVKANDSLWQIAKDNNISLDELIKLNPTKKNMIHPNDVLKLEPYKTTKKVNVREERLKEERLNLSDITAIQGYNHDSNYVIVDKKNRKFTVYDKDNNLLYTTSDFATGLSGNDYNTITYIDENGKIINGKGNNSTPAGITEIKSKGTYHGYPSFIRSRIESDGSKSDIASSIHYSNIGNERNASNGCIRVGGKTLCDLDKYITSGTRIYTLPEKEGSRFTLKGGRLNFTADNPYGINEGDKKYWDDYNVYTDKTYSPLIIEYKPTGDEEYDRNVRDYTDALELSKEMVMNDFNLSSSDYDLLAEIALGIAQQESKFGTAASYKYYKDFVADDIKTSAKYVKQFFKGDFTGKHVTKNSQGMTQIKLKGDNQSLKDIYNFYGIDENTIRQSDIAALATVIRLANIYNNEVKGKKFIGANNTKLSPYHVLMYKWNGRNSILNNRTADPSTNEYIKNVEKYSKNFQLYNYRTYNTYKYGGRISLQYL